MTGFPVAEFAGGIAFATLVASPLMRGRAGILGMQLAAGVSFATHYAALGVLAASAVNVVGAVQTSVAIFAPSNRKLRNLGWFLVPLILVTALVFWTGPVSILSSLAMAFIAIGRMQEDERRLRTLILIGGAFWIGHDYLVASWIALAADVFCAVFGAVVVLRRFPPIGAASPFAGRHIATEA